MGAVHRLIGTVAPTDSTVLILGETGTGKELAAKTIYQQSKRADMPFVAVNCGALPENLVESELFGHRKGAFTGADRDHKGLFEVSNGGTLFLDEVGELNKNIQVKLLRFLESGEIRRLGDTEPFRLDVRVLCATHRDLRLMIQEEDFREDLFFRINTFEIRLPSLRERRADIPELARHLLSRAARRPIEQVAELLSPEAVDVLLEHEWRGNVRQLANAMEYSYIISGGGVIQPEHLPSDVRIRPRHADQHGRRQRGAMSAATRLRPAVRARCTKSRWNTSSAWWPTRRQQAAAAKELGISLKTLLQQAAPDGRRARSRLARWKESLHDSFRNHGILFLFSDRPRRARTVIPPLAVSTQPYVLLFFFFAFFPGESRSVRRYRPSPGREHARPS